MNDEFHDDHTNVHDFRFNRVHGVHHTSVSTGNNVGTLVEVTTIALRAPR